MGDFNYYVKPLESPGYLLIEVPEDIKKELQGSIDALEKTPETDARHSLRVDFTYHTRDKEIY